MKPIVTIRKKASLEATTLPQQEGEIMGKLVDGDYKLELRKVIKKTFNFFGQDITVPVVSEEPYVTQMVAIKDDKAGDIAILAHPDLTVDFVFPPVSSTMFRGTTSWGDILIGTRQKSAGDISW